MTKFFLIALGTVLILLGLNSNVVYSQNPFSYSTPQNWIQAGYRETQPGLLQKVNFPVSNGNIPLLNYYTVAPNTFEVVENGRIIDGVEIGGSWSVGDNYVEQTGTEKYLAVRSNSFGNDMVFAARLSLATLNQTNASFCFGEENFGFDGDNKQFFTEGATWGATQFHGAASAYISPNTYFALKVIRRGNSVSFYINNHPIVTKNFDPNIPVDFIALRPGKNTMRVQKFRTLGGGFNEDGTLVSPYSYNGQFTLALPNKSLRDYERGTVSVAADDPYSFEEFVLDAYGG
jgi:hypothetical protein